MDAEQFLALGETEARFELVDGVVTLSPGPFPSHQRVVHELCFQIESWARRSGALVFPDTDVVFGRALVYRPAIAVYAAGRFESVPRTLREPPDLVIEVLSAGSKPLDLITKREDYERFGVGEYIAVDPDSGRVHRWLRQDGAFGEPPVLGGTLESSALPGLVFDLAAVRAAAKRAV